MYPDLDMQNITPHFQLCIQLISISITGKFQDIKKNNDQIKATKSPKAHC